LERTLKLVGKTSNEIFLLRYPSSLLDFCDFDLSAFAKDSIDMCNEALKTGVFDADRAAELRKDIQAAHCYIRHHIRTIYEKVVIDCWIDYVCRRDNIGDSALWNRFTRCKTPFEKIVFARLCDFRYNRDINQWLNIVRVQDYARTKVNFVFIETARSVGEIIARRNYFDLAFSVTAREMGCRIEDLGVIKVFPVGRIPTAPFMFPNISKEIVRHVLADYDYGDDYSDVDDYEEISDQIAMDAFSRMKEGLPQELSSYSVVSGKMENFPEKLYMPCSLKAVVDLEIDVMLENGAWLAKCKRCGRYFMKDNEHPEDYCSFFMPNGKTCLEIWEEEHPKPKVTAALEERCKEVTDEIYARVDKTMSVKEYDYWHNYLEAMKKKVDNGEITPAELEDFLNYSLEVDITKSHPIVEVPKKEPEPPKKGVVRPFVPERISRSDIAQSPVAEEEPEVERAPREGFFTSPIKERRKSERPQISHIIRGGESLGEGYTKKPDPAGFQPFGTPARTEPPVSEPKPVTPARTEPPISEPKPVTYAHIEPSIPEPQSATTDSEPKKRSPFENLKRLEEKLEEERSQNERVARAESPERIERRVSRPFESSDNDENAFRPIGGQSVPERRRTQRPQSRYSDEFEYEEPQRSAPSEPVSQPEQVAPPPPPKPKVIRKNAAAISAYGKIVGAKITTAPPEMEIISEPPERTMPEKTIHERTVHEPETMDLSDISEVREAPEQIKRDTVPEPPETDPFKDIESIFDVLEKSETDMGARPKRGRPRRAASDSSEPSAERESGEKPLPKTVTKENAPSGIWTEDRGLFDGTEKTEQSELDMLKEKKHGKSNKTRRLYDVIMREPDDNPNFRR